MKYIMQEEKYDNGTLLKDCVNGKYHNKKAIFKATYNNEGLLFNFYCEDDDIFSTMTKFNDNLFNEDVVEIFISPDRNLKKYIEIEISPLENILQLNITNDLKGNFKTDFILKDEIKRKVIKNADSWTAEFFVPFSLLGIVGKKGDNWLFNAYRIDRNGSKFNFYALNPTFKPEFHHPENFIDLIFN